MEQVTLDNLVREGARAVLHARITRLTETLHAFLLKSPEPTFPTIAPEANHRPKTEELISRLRTLEEDIYNLFEADAEAAGLKAFFAKVRALPEPRKVLEDDQDDLNYDVRKKRP